MFWLWLLLVVCGVVAGVVPLLPKSWPVVVQALLGVLAAVAAGAAGTYVTDLIAVRRRSVEVRRAEVAEPGARRAALAATGERAAADQSVAGLLRPERAVVDFVGREERNWSCCGSGVLMRGRVRCGW
ncbi:hypothetical protein AGRA3207_004811 [Actinomadura graeca]|uniref:Uncharacterized protein n=1 Tax=Actinomadura graeca TaxID=2750812 RepID=A0ABX8QZK8_9ACTN|nr:hypothetical protein [Actinomadura graeca]QXJ23629.1 hypothetical protein AGRA3207_004811 [Actinomadura graeca]